MTDWLRHEARSIAESGDFFFQEALLSRSSGLDNPRYIKRDFVFTSGLWRGHMQQPLVGSGYRGDVVVGHSDLVTRCVSLLLMKLNSGGRVYCSNLDCSRSINAALGAVRLPLGLTNPTSETSLHPVLGNQAHIATVMAEPLVEQRLALYANFDSATAPKHRRVVAKRCNTLDHVVEGHSDYTPAGRISYLRHMRDYRLVVCPRGNGLDTHRFWEALYVGALPVVLNNSYQAALARELRLPFVGLRSWNGLANFREVLSKAEAVLSSDKFSLEGARLSYWESRIFDAA
jgi:hypothetical protein